MSVANGPAYIHKLLQISREKTQIYKLVRHFDGICNARRPGKHVVAIMAKLKGKLTHKTRNGKYELSLACG